jgi:hypothetical protein
MIPLRKFVGTLNGPPMDDADDDDVGDEPYLASCKK